MESPYLLVLIGLLFVVMMGGLSLMRREGLSIQFAIESIGITAVVVWLSFLNLVHLHPVLFLILLYLLTMRVRLLVDLGNTLGSRGNYNAAGRTYRLANRLGPDPAGRMSIRVNQGVTWLHQGALDEAIAAFQGALASVRHSGLGIKQEAACHYNLGVAYQRKGQGEKSLAEFRRVLEVWPVSEYARRATQLLNRGLQETQKK